MGVSQTNIIKYHCFTALKKACTVTVIMHCYSVRDNIYIFKIYIQHSIQHIPPCLIHLDQVVTSACSASPKVDPRAAPPTQRSRPTSSQRMRWRRRFGPATRTTQRATAVEDEHIAKSDGPTGEFYCDDMRLRTEV